MNKRIIISLLSLLSLGVSIEMYAANHKFSEGFEFLPSALTTLDPVSAISVIGNKVAFVRNDSTYTTVNDSSSYDFIEYNVLPNWTTRAKGQTAYDTASSTLYFVADYKLYSVNPNAKVQIPRALVINGLTNVRQDFEGSSIAARNWRYKEPDTIKIYNPTLAKGGKRLFFSAEMEGGMGGRDIWYIDKIDGKGNKWSKPRNANRISATDDDSLAASLPTAINSTGNEDCPFVLNDSILYFSSDREASFQGWNIYSIPLKKGAKVTLMPEGVNSNSDDKTLVETKRAIYVLSNRDGAPAIYVPTRYKVNKTDNELLADVNINEPQEVAVTNQETNNDYGKDETKVYTLYFMFSQDVMIDNYDKEIEEIKSIIQKNPKGNFAIYGHTDQVGTDAYNQKLSEKRAKMVYNLLIKKGINKKQLHYKGFGSTIPQIKNPKNDEEMQKNRRVEVFRIETDN